jgi:hypothetical protein
MMTYINRAIEDILKVRFLQIDVENRIDEYGEKLFIKK